MRCAHWVCLVCIDEHVHIGLQEAEGERERERERERGREREGEEENGCPICLAAWGWPGHLAQVEHQHSAPRTEGDNDISPGSETDYA
jgi:hypothetical protein